MALLNDRSCSRCASPATARYADGPADNTATKAKRGAPLRRPPLPSDGPWPIACPSFFSLGRSLSATARGSSGGWPHGWHATVWIVAHDLLPGATTSENVVSFDPHSLPNDPDLAGPASMNVSGTNVALRASGFQFSPPRVMHNLCTGPNERGVTAACSIGCCRNAACNGHHRSRQGRSARDRLRRDH